MTPGNKAHAPDYASGAASPRLRGSEGGTIVLLGVIAALYFAREILIPFAFALTFTFVLAPAVALLEKLRIGRVASALAAVLASIAVAGGIGWVIANQLIDVANQLPLYRQNIRVKIDTLHLPASGGLGQAAESVREVVGELASTDAASPLSPPSDKKQPGAPSAPVPVPSVPVHIAEPPSTWAQLRDFGTPILAPLGRAGVVIIFTIFILFKREDLRNRLLLLAGLGKLNVMTLALDDAASRVSRYLMLQFLVNAGLGTLFGLGLYWIGVPYAALWGAIAGLLRTVPYVGTLIAATLPILLSLAVFDGWLEPLLVFLLIAGLELVIANFIEPWLYGAHVGISSLALLVTTVFWTVLWGPAGLILSTPLTVCVAVLGRYFPQFSFLHILLGDEPVLGPETQFYQRLLAMDQMEAHTIADEFLKGKDLIELYDSVLIPALSMAEQDRHKGAIDAAREEFLFLSLNEMIAELSDYPMAESLVEESSSSPAREPSYARILCIPGHDRADEVTASMLAQLLERKGLAAMAFPAGSFPREWIAELEATPGNIVCISALPPYAFSPARAMCKQIRERFPKLKIMVCVWGYKGDKLKAQARFERYQPDCLSTSLAEAIEYVEDAVRGKKQETPQIA